MNMRSKIFAVFFLLAGCFSAASSQAITWPTLDAVTDGGVVTNNLATVLNVTETGLIEKAQKGIKNAKAKYDEYKGYYEGVFNKEKAPLDGSMVIRESSIADIEDPESVRRAVYDLFLAYPSNDEFERRQYQEKAERFYQDTINELYTSVRLVEQDYENNIKPRIEKMSTELMTGESGASNADDENGSWKNAYNAYKTMDDLVQVLEELTAMKAQYEAAAAIKNHLRPAPPPETDSSGEKEANAGSIYKFASASKSETLAFAQVQSEKEPQSSGYSYRYNPDAEAAVSFVEAPKPDIDSPFAANRDKLEDIKKLNPIYYKALDALKVHNLLQSLPSKRQSFAKYEQFVRLHEKAVEAVKQSDQCVIDYLGRYYSDAETLWYGGYIGDQITDYDLRSGLSGWAIAAYDTAKAAQDEEEVDTSVFSEIKYDDNIDSRNVSSIAAQEASVKKEAESNNGFIRTEDKNKAEDDARATEIMAWNIGAEAAKMLADDQYASSHEWGSPTKRFPVWNDMKSFYGQYLDGKYENMKDFLERLNFDAKIVALALELNKLSTAEKTVKLFAEARLKSMEAALKDIPEIVSEDETDVALAENDKQKDVAILKKNKESALKTLQDAKRRYEQELDDINEDINENNKTLNRLQYPDLQGDEKLPEDTDAAAVEMQAQTNSRKKSAVQAKIDNVSAKIAVLEKAYINKEQAIDEKYNSSLSELLKKLENNKEKSKISQLASTVLENVTGNGINTILFNEGSGYLINLLSSSRGIMDDTKNYAAQLIDKAKEDLYGMGDELYLPQTGEQIVARHKKLIRELKQLPFDSMMASFDSAQKISGSPTAVDLVTTAFQAVLSQTVCIEADCEKADEEYFVGNAGKSRDFMAPKAAPENTFAPIREIVHLDYVDYNNIPQSNDRSVSKEGILNYGLPVPEVWKLMLKNPAYVEKDMDLSKALALGGEETVFMRGGILPCRSGNIVIDALGNKNGYYVAELKNTEQSQFRTCLSLEAQRGNMSLGNIKNALKLGGLGRLATIYNKEIKKSATALFEEGITAASPSELGVFLKYSGNKLYFGNIERETYERINEIMNDQSQTEYEENITDDMYQKASFRENQIGSFLNVMETEREYRQHVEEMKIKIDELQEEVVSELQKAGFSPAEDFNLADEEDYEQARKTLDSLKNARLSEAYTDLEEINNPGDNVVSDRIDSVRNMMDAMTMDKDELLQLSQNSLADSELEEEIKREEANQAAAEKYQKEADEAFEKEIDNFEIPYCAAY